MIPEKTRTTEEVYKLGLAMSLMEVLIVLILLQGIVVATHGRRTDTMYQSFLPLTHEKLDLVSRVSQYCDEIFRTKTASWFVSTRNGEFFKGKTFLGETPIDAAYLINENNQCIVTFLSTRPNIRDWGQNLDFSTQTVVSRTNSSIQCLAHGGFYKSYANSIYRTKLEAAIDKCMSQNSETKLIITGHSQGGAIAMVAGVVLEEYKPLIITFGQPPVFVRRYRNRNSICTAIPNSNIWRFVNTEIHQNIAIVYGRGKSTMEYDPAPFAPVFTIQKAEEKTRVLISYHLGPSILLPPGDSNGRMMVGSSVAYSETWPYNNFQNILRLDWIDKDFTYGLFYGGVLNAIVSAHSISTYTYKLQYLKSSGPNPIDTNGFDVTSLCNYDFECSNGSNCINSVCTSTQQHSRNINKTYLDTTKQSLKSE